MSSWKKKSSLTMSNYAQGAEALLIAMQTPSPKGFTGIPVLIWGKPGAGKSSFLEGLEAEDFPVLTLIASIHDPTDFSGLPVHYDGMVKYAIPEWVNQFDEKGGLLFLDELTTAPPAVQAALLRVVLERKVGFHPLPSNVRIVAAANPPDMMTGGWELSPPLRNRFVHIEWDLPASVYLNALQDGFDKAVLPEIPIDKHATLVDAWKLKINAFLKRSPHSLSTPPEDDNYAFASPRTWDYVAALMASCEYLGIAPGKSKKASGASMALLKGCVGQGVAVSFLGFLKNLKLPDPEKVLDGEIEVEVSKLDDSEIYVLFGALNAVLFSRFETEELLHSVYNYFELAEKVFENGRRDLIFVSLKKAARNHLLFKKAIDVASSVNPEEAKKMTEAINKLVADQELTDFIKILI